MKSLTIIFLALTIPFPIQAQESEYENIETVLNYYLEGGTNNDFETLKKAFHENAMMKAMYDEMVEVNALEFFGSRMEPGPAQDRKTRISYINIAGNAANARLEIEYADFMFVDYMSLLKVEGEWKIVSKVFTRI